MRAYQPLWEQLKRDGAVIVECPLPLRNRIRKALKKERSFDAVFAQRYPRASMYFTRHPAGWHIQLCTELRTTAL